MHFRRCRWRALAALVAFVASMGVRAADTGHAIGAEPDIDAGLIGAAASASAVSAVRANPAVEPTGEEHCVICHWARTFTGSLAGESVRVNSAEAAALSCLKADADATNTSRVAAPPRGPPTLL